MRPLRRVVQIVLACMAAASATACSGGGEAKLAVGDLPALAAAQSLAPRAFTATSAWGGATVEVDGVVADDYRFSATVSVNGRVAYEEVVIDDARYLRVLDAAALFPPETAAALGQIHPALGPISSGGWVVDFAGSPPEFTPAGTIIPLAPELVLRQVRALDGVGELIKRGFREYNRDAVNYLPKEDKFPEHKEDGDRFDHLPRPYDPNAVVTTVESVRPFFEYVSVWSTRSGLTRIEQWLQFPDRKDGRYSAVFEQIDRAGSRRLQALLAGPDAEPGIRETYTVRATSAAVAAPTGATTVDLTGAVAALRQSLAAAAIATPLFGPVE